jgi:PAS domain S-box-containing protein
LEALTNLLFLLGSSGTDQREHLEEAEHQLARINTLVRSILALDEDHEVGIEQGSRLLDPNALRRYKQRYEEAMHLAAIVEGAQDAIYSKKLDGTILAWNAGAEQLFGYSSSEALGRSIRILVPPDLPDDERTIMEKLRRGLHIQSYETTRQTKDGKLIKVSVSVSPIFNTSGKVVGASTIARRLQTTEDPD